MSTDKSAEIRKACTKFVNHHPGKSMKDWFETLAAYVSDEDGDRYGDGSYMNDFEKEIAELLGHEAAVFMPSGTMAQQIALRIWSEKQHNSKIVMHPTAHLEGAEYYAYQYLHHLQRIQHGVPEFIGNRLFTLEDFTKLKETPGSVLLELPQRELGGQLPEWDELISIVEWARERKIKLHLDGARIWEAQPYYDRPLSEIGQLFDSVYVSFYKGLDGIAGCMLLGPQAFIDEAKIWQRRMGGNLRQLFPLYVAAKWGLERNLPKMEDYYERAKQLAAALNDMDVFETNPRVPQTNMFHLFIKGSKEDIEQAHLAVAEETKMWMINGTSPSIIPAYRWAELVIGGASNELDMAEIIANFQLFAEKVHH